MGNIMHLGRSKHQRDPCPLSPPGRGFFPLYVLFLSSWSLKDFRYVNFLTPGVSFALDCKCLEAGDLGFCGLQPATPRQFVSAY